MDQIEISGLEFQTIIGVYPWERKLKQPIWLDITLPTDAARAAKTDQLANALDYAQISQAIGEWIGQTQFQLIETLAEHLAQFLGSTFHLPWVKLTLSKPGAVPQAANVSIQIERFFGPKIP